MEFRIEREPGLLPMYSLYRWQDTYPSGWKFHGVYMTKFGCKRVAKQIKENAERPNNSETFTL